MSTFRYTRPGNFPPVVKNLIIINVLVWVAQLVFNSSFDLTSKLALYPIDSPQFEPYQIATHMFAHAAVAGTGENTVPVLSHIFFNMFNLWFFGRMLENVWGPKRFLLFYLVCGVGAAAFHLLVQHLQYDPELVRQFEVARMMGRTEDAMEILSRIRFGNPAVGASGAVMGLIAGAALLFPNTQLMMLFIPFPIKLKWLALVMIALDLFGGFNPYIRSGIAHFAHLGGAITGFILIIIWNKTNRKSLY